MRACDCIRSRPPSFTETPPVAVSNVSGGRLVVVFAFCIRRGTAGRAPKASQGLGKRRLGDRACPANFLGAMKPHPSRARRPRKIKRQCVGHPPISISIFAADRQSTRSGSRAQSSGFARQDLNVAPRSSARHSTNHARQQDLPQRAPRRHKQHRGRLESPAFAAQRAGHPRRLLTYLRGSVGRKLLNSL